MRNLRRDKKGQMRVIEAFFAAVLILSCLTLIPAQSPQDNTSETNLAAMVENTMLTLDEDGHLAALIDQGNWSSLGDCVESALPLAVWYNLTVCNQNGEALNPYPICNGGAVSNTIISYTYVCASQNSTYTIYVLQLQLAVVD